MPGQTQHLMNAVLATMTVWYVGGAYSQDLPPAPATSPATTTTMAEVSSVLQPEAGEIMLEGIIQRLAPSGSNTATVGFALRALSFGLPGKPARAINPPKIKMVTIETQAVPAGSLPLKAGTRVRVVGPDQGSGAALTARALVVLAASGPAGDNPAPARVSPVPAKAMPQPRLASRVAPLAQRGLPPRGVTIVQAPLKEWGKGWVTQFTPDGNTVQGRFFHSKKGTPSDWREWQWNPIKGFQMGKPAREGDHVRDTEDPPPAGQLAAWNKKYGWQDTLPGRRIGSHVALGLFPTSMSRDGSIVVGRYLCDVTGDRSGDATSGSVNGQNRSWFNRCFVWRKGTGFHDLWDYVAPARNIEPKWKGGRDSCAVSPNGRKIVAVTDQLYVLSTRTGFPFPKTASDTAPLA